MGREYGLQQELLKGEIERSVINKSKFADLRHIPEPYLKSDVLCLDLHLLDILWKCRIWVDLVSKTV